MPVHDWTRAEAWQFHHFHTVWLTHLAEHLNCGGLPAGYEAYSEQRAELYIPDVLALGAVGPRPRPAGESGAVAVADTRTRRRTPAGKLPALGRAVAVRHASRRRVVAVIEVVSPRNKDRAEAVGDFAGKVAGMVRGGVHAVVLDLLPPGRHDPRGIHPAVWSMLDDDRPGEPPPPGEPLTLVGYQAEPLPVAHEEYAAVGRPLPAVPLFLDDGAFVELPLEDTYMSGFTRLPAALRADLGG
jgi:Protein of unknown function (DUF4058)